MNSSFPLLCYGIKHVAPTNRHPCLKKNTQSVATLKSAHAHQIYNVFCALQNMYI